MYLALYKCKRVRLCGARKIRVRTKKVDLTLLKIFQLFESTYWPYFEIHSNKIEIYLDKANLKLIFLIKLHSPEKNFKNIQKLLLPVLLYKNIDFNLQSGLEIFKTPGSQFLSQFATKNYRMFCILCNFLIY